ncbi:MAG: transporter [Nibricoccus sp.]
MKTKSICWSCFLSFVGSLATTGTVRAVEGALGRPISGAAVMPYGGVVPPTPGISFVPAELYYAGSIGGGRTTPLGANLALNLDLQASFTMLSGIYIWNTPNKDWNFASSLSLPVTWLEAEADVTVGPHVGSTKDHDFGLFDLVFAPIVASYHLTPDSHVAFGLTVWAPTGSYDPNRLANLSTNTWTFIPTFTYTRLFRESGLEFTSSWELTFDTENSDTNYQNGVLSDFEFLVMKHAPHGLGFGVVGSWIEQLNDDSGPTADKLHGFKGHAIGLGAILGWAVPLKKQTLEIDLRWVHEFDVKNRVEGDLIALTMSAQL